MPFPEPHSRLDTELSSSADTFSPSRHPVVRRRQDITNHEPRCPSNELTSASLMSGWQPSGPTDTSHQQRIKGFPCRRAGRTQGLAGFATWQGHITMVCACWYAKTGLLEVLTGHFLAALSKPTLPESPTPEIKPIYQWRCTDHLLRQLLGPPWSPLWARYFLGNGYRVDKVLASSKTWYSSPPTLIITPRSA
jgi:hypothetical protein